MTNPSDHIQGILDNLPVKPGCYLMKNASGKIVYVGKAINLRSRVRSYFHTGAGHTRKTQRMVYEIADIDFILVESELEALILEMNLIKKHLPEYNVRLKDDKRYPFIKVLWTDPFPKVIVTRQHEKDGSRYYGPFTSVWAVHQTLDLLRKIFQYRSCDRIITGEDPRACLYYDIKLCTAPCIGKINQQDYRQMIDDLCKFLEGHTDPILDRLRGQMQHHSDQMNFEQAAVVRDQIMAIEKVVERQKIISNREEDSDVIALARSNGESCMQVFFIRNGRLIGREYFILEGTEDEADSEVISEFIKQFYAEASHIPREVLLPNEVEEAVIIQQWLNQQRGGQKVQIRIPRRGTSRDLVKMATENAVETLSALKSQWEADTHKQSQALGELQKALGMPNPPNRIECYDISNIHGTAAVGSMVVFEQGVPNKKLYRRFNIKSVSGPDDFASMEEVLARRFKRWQSSQERHMVGEKVDESFAILPDLLIVDGGKGQISRAVKVAEGYEHPEGLLIVGLAKEHELIFLPDRDLPVELPRNSQGLYLMQRIRDEAHRFAITAHRKMRQKERLVSRLDQIAGIGPARKKALLKTFGSLDGVRQASVDDISKVPGITPALAEAIHQKLSTIQDNGEL
ncbi:MAG: excinuclease ABC subunit UvrC [Chloroflexi bacterium]|nr:excinuclease ABC subunit UvrC [Chloroflexota bacterium]